MQEKNNEIKKFIIKLTAVVIAIIVIINVTYNLILADKLENINMILNLDEKENIEKMKDKIRIEINRGVNCRVGWIGSLQSLILEGSLRRQFENHHSLHS